MQKLTLEQLQHAAYFLPYKVDRLERWHCTCGCIMSREWNEEAEQWEWFCSNDGCQDEMLTERAIIEAYNEYCSRYDYGNNSIKID